jgi:hypothetical protein
MLPQPLVKTPNKIAKTTKRQTPSLTVVIDHLRGAIPMTHKLKSPP